MKNLIKNWPILISILFIGTLAFFLVNRSTENQIEPRPILTFDEKNIALVKTLKSPDGSTLGDIYVTYINKDVFSSLLVSKEVEGRNIVIYKADKDGLFNTQGKDVGIAHGNFYGYEFSNIGDDHFIFHYLGDEGKSVGDEMTVKWNYDKKIFEAEKPNFEENLISAGELTAQNGSLLGKIYVVYLDKNIVTSLYIVSVSKNESHAIYRIDGEGFFNPVEKEKDVSREDFYGYEFSKTKNDQLTIRLLTSQAKTISNNIVIGWNYEKKVFEIQK